MPSRLTPLAVIAPLFAMQAQAPEPTFLEKVGPSQPLPPIPRPLSAKYCTDQASSVFAPEEKSILHCGSNKIERLRDENDVCPEIQNRIDYELLMIDILQENHTAHDADGRRRRGLIESLRDGAARLCSLNVS